ncbi:MAG: class I SAM-dependent methyltransferase [bacterium]
MNVNTYPGLDMKTVPGSNTQKNVNRDIMRLLQRFTDLASLKTVLDIPCGEGEWAHFLKSRFPHLRILGVDKFAKVKFDDFEFHQMDIHDFFQTVKPANVDLISSISGVMCFDGIESLFAHFRSSLTTGGHLVVTNDNIMTVRDRLSFLFFGYFRRFRLLFSPSEGNWNVVLPQALVMFLQRNGFQIEAIKYTSIYFEDYLLLPVALLIYPFLAFNLVRYRSEIPLKVRFQIFPFKMLLARHYVMIAKKI